MKNEIHEEILKLGRMVGQMPRDKVAYCIIKLYMQSEELSEGARNRFVNWLLSPEDTEAKDKALARCFNEMVECNFVEQPA